MATITQEQEQAIREYLAGRHIPSGLGTEEEACSIASINLALTGTLTDTIPDCMSSVIGRWIIGVQDSMPDELRNSDEWRNLLPLAAGTGRALEAERLEIILDWMWGTVLPQLQPIADEHGFGEAWRTMLGQRTSEAAYAANAASDDGDAAAAAYAANAASDAAYAASDDGDADAAAYAANAASDAAYAARAARSNFWQAVDPCELLKRLIDVKG